MNIDNTIIVDVDNNFKDFTYEEYYDNLINLGGISHESLVGKSVYYSKKVYGYHTIIKWDSKKAEFLIDYQGQKFYTNPFRIFI